MKTMNSFLVKAEHDKNRGDLIWSVRDFPMTFEMKRAAQRELGIFQFLRYRYREENNDRESVFCLAVGSPKFEDIIIKTTNRSGILSHRGRLSNKTCDTQWDSA